MPNSRSETQQNGLPIVGQAARIRPRTCLVESVHPCQNLFHFGVPWNPSRLEQRNGRIDRKLQPSPEVFCHYFVYTQRPEDRVLRALPRKTETIRRYWDKWLANVEGDLQRETDRVRQFYQVASFRIEPVGLACLWPVTG